MNTQERRDPKNEKKYEINLPYIESDRNKVPITLNKLQNRVDGLKNIVELERLI